MKRVRLEELQNVVHEVVARLPVKTDAATLVALRGDLGAGKTTFVQALAKALGVTAIIQSPTYVLMKKYQISNNKFQTLVHIDAYRLEGAQEFAALKPEQFLSDPTALVLLEWPEKVGPALPTPDLVLNFSSQDAGEGERYIEVV